MKHFTLLSAGLICALSISLATAQNRPPMHGLTVRIEATRPFSIQTQAAGGTPSGPVGLIQAQTINFSNPSDAVLRNNPTLESLFAQNMFMSESIRRSRGAVAIPSTRTAASAYCQHNRAFSTPNPWTTESQALPMDRSGCNVQWNTLTTCTSVPSTTNPDRTVLRLTRSHQAVIPDSEPCRASLRQMVRLPRVVLRASRRAADAGVVDLSSIAAGVSNSPLTPFAVQLFQSLPAGNQDTLLLLLENLRSLQVSASIDYP